MTTFALPATLALLAFTACIVPYDEVNTAKQIASEDFGVDDVKSTMFVGPDLAPAPGAALEQAKGLKDFFGTQFGLGPAILFGIDEVESAKVVGDGTNARVVVNEESENRAALVLEWHHFFQLEGDKGMRSTKIGTGPFVALAIGSTDAVIEGLGLGWMIGWDIGSEPSQERSFNIGLGAFLQNDVKKLGSGFDEGKPPPNGLTSVEFTEEDEIVPMLLLSFRWGF